MRMHHGHKVPNRDQQAGRSGRAGAGAAARGGRMVGVDGGEADMVAGAEFPGAQADGVEEHHPTGSLGRSRDRDLHHVRPPWVVDTSTIHAAVCLSMIKSCGLRRVKIEQNVVIFE